MFILSSMSRGITVWKYKIMFLGKVRAIIQQYHIKKNVNKLKFSRKALLTKKPVEKDALN